MYEALLFTSAVIGTSAASGVTVTAAAVREGKEKKILVVKYKSKKGERK